MTDSRPGLPSTDRPPLTPSSRRTPKASEVIARDLVRYITENGLPEGAMLPVEREMLKMLGVGRTTLREALRLLESRGMLEIRTGPKGGPVVRRPAADSMAESLSLVLQFDGATMADVLEARQAFEPALAGLAASRITAAQLAELDESSERIVAAPQDHDVFVRENMRFHEVVAEAAGSVVLKLFLAQLESIREAELVGADYTAKRRKAVAAVHAEIAEALRAGDPALATERMREHVSEATKYWRTKHKDLYNRQIRWSA